MTKIDIYSGFLGAGKTTLIKKMIAEAYRGERVVLIENEFGEIGIDGGFLRDSGVEITEMNSGCICCSLVGDFATALGKVVSEYSPDRIIIEPSGVGKLSDVILAVERAELKDASLNAFVTVVDANKCKMYMKNFGEFFNNQIENASAIIISHEDVASEEKISECVELLRSHNSDAVIISTPWKQLTGKQILASVEEKSTLEKELDKLREEESVCPVCGHHHDDDDDEHEHHCHHHDDDDDEHEHHHDEHCGCGHHHHHHADEVFESIGRETPKKYTKEEIENALKALADSEKYGIILRAKGMVANAEKDTFIHFDYVPGEPDVRDGSPDVIGRICVIGSKINENEILKLFSL